MASSNVRRREKEQHIGGHTPQGEKVPAASARAVPCYQLAGHPVQ